MKRNYQISFYSSLLLAGALFALPPKTVRAQETERESPQPALSVAAKFDEYGNVRHCDETARLDNFAITLQNDSSTKGYLLIYAGKDDLPAHLPAVFERAKDYLVNLRGLEPQRVKVINAGHRTKRTTELWIAADGVPEPTPTDTIEVTREANRAYQWDEVSINVEYYADLQPEDRQVENSEEGDESYVPDVKTQEDVEWQKSVEKYEIAIESRRASEPESPDDLYSGEHTEKVTLWWDVDSFVKALGAEPGARACLIFYSDSASADQEKVINLVSRAKARLEREHDIETGRIVTIDGGYSEQPSVELWIVPKQASLPKPKVYEKKEDTDTEETTSDGLKDTAINHSTDEERTEP